jgi:hypothetical protein
MALTLRSAEKYEHNDFISEWFAYQATLPALVSCGYHVVIMWLSCGYHVVIIGYHTVIEEIFRSESSAFHC